VANYLAVCLKGVLESVVRKFWDSKRYVPSLGNQKRTLHGGKICEEKKVWAIRSGEEKGDLKKGHDLELNRTQAGAYSAGGGGGGEIEGFRGISCGKSRLEPDHKRIYPGTGIKI